MNGMDPLAALRPLHAPPPISWWPPAPGWWLLLLLLLLLILLAIRWWRHNAPKRAALQELKALAKSAPDPLRQAAAVNRLLKRYALVCWPHSETAALTGEAWLAFLDAHGGKGEFVNGNGRLLATQPYAAPNSVESFGVTEQTKLMHLVRRWIRVNRPMS
ncbi:MAG: DUF4381 domain-containing protein [Chromatiales bacterium]|jgi:hypothetical protein